MQDKNGTELKIGDLMAEITGGGSGENGPFTTITLWAVPKMQDGRGTIYTSKGKRTYYYWARHYNSVKLDPKKLPRWFMYAFRHGLQSIDVLNSKMSDDIHTTIANSNWKDNALTPDTVKHHLSLVDMKIKSFSDIADNWDFIFAYDNVPSDTMFQIISLTGYKKAIPINGEIGIAYMRDQMAFYTLYGILKDWKEKNVLKEKCKELDDGKSSLKFERE